MRGAFTAAIGSDDLDAFAEPDKHDKAIANDPLVVGNDDADRGPAHADTVATTLHRGSTHSAVTGP